jgi:hypothetical protein
VTDQDLGSKLKARMGRWQTYADQPQATSEPNRSSEEIPFWASSAPSSQAGLALAPFEIGEQASDPADEATPSPETHIADLQVALEHEREQSRRLLDTVAREQVLHAVTLQSQVWRVRTDANSQKQSFQIIEESPAERISEPNRERENYLLWIAVVLFIGLGCSGFVYLILK